MHNTYRMLYFPPGDKIKLRGVHQDFLGRLEGKLHRVKKIQRKTNTKEYNKFLPYRMPETEFERLLRIIEAYPDTLSIRKVQIGKHGFGFEVGGVERNGYRPIVRFVYKQLPENYNQKRLDNLAEKQASKAEKYK